MHFYPCYFILFKLGHTSFFLSPLRWLLSINNHWFLYQYYFRQRTLSSKCEFGFLFDIDGVIVRGRKPLPLAREAFQLLTKDKQFKIPTLFVTNAGNSLRCRKAQQLSEWLDIEVSETTIWVVGYRCKWNNYVSGWI